MKLTARNIHRDLGYFYFGLVIAFSISGIFLNHRQTWHPMNYVYSSEDITIKLPESRTNINDDYISTLSLQWELQKDYRGFRIRGNKLLIDYKDDRFAIDLITGKGKRESYRITPLLGQMTLLHVSTKDAWIWYSDIFGLAMLTIAVTGILIQKGRTGFSNRGWKLALVGVVFPLLFLVFVY